ncbi:phenylacetate--CoA ligase family protein [Capnocytophaga gingivalis]|jgi:phenylacetate--coA ligase|uniref:Phenylacetate--CoA ligase n=1 Tax=Capnocytophaga gingivalis TaxID=1017 RepID=A0A250FL77_9FLAO|nr:AMP-binding protein [Capnocytophaga gingivalis]ATA85863.1 phenylacetate--CoA ligase [Capnocytophaga gingivalis]
MSFPIPVIETQSKDAIRLFQEEKLRELLQYLKEKSPYYQRLFRENNIDITQIQHLEDLQRLPTTSKDDLQRYNDDFLCVPKEAIVDYASTSGTLGKPVTFGLTDRDLDRLAYNEAISLSCAGISQGDVVQLMTTIDRRFMAGLAYFLGIRHLGASIVRIGAGIPELQWDSILSYHPTYLIAVPSFLLKLIEYAEKNGIDYRHSSVKGVVCIGETLRQQDFSPNLLTDKIMEKWPELRLYSTYASTEMSTTFTECDALQGGHHHPELIITEVLDDEGNPLPYGQLGELTITTLGVEGMPLLRFRTGDMVTLHDTPCSCGRNTLRVSPVVGRKQQMIKYKGTTLYPPALMDLLTEFAQVENYIIEISSNEILTDEILIKIGTCEPSEALKEEIANHFRAKMRVVPKIEFYPVDTIEEQLYPKGSRKPVKFIDRRGE